MPVKRLVNQPRVTTMVCTSCDVTWRGGSKDDCWSCGKATKVTQATPRKVRHSPAVVEAERLVG